MSVLNYIFVLSFFYPERHEYVLVSPLNNFMVSSIQQTESGFNAGNFSVIIIRSYHLTFRWYYRPITYGDERCTPPITHIENSIKISLYTHSLLSQANLLFSDVRKKQSEKKIPVIWTEMWNGISRNPDKTKCNIPPPPLVRGRWAGHLWNQIRVSR